MNTHLIDEGENVKMTWEHMKIAMKQNDVTDEEKQQQLNHTCDLCMCIWITLFCIR